MADNQPSTQDSTGISRAPDGTIANQGQTTTQAATTPQTSTTTEAESTTTEATEDKSLLNQDGRSLANQPADKSEEGAPEAYSDFKVPEGYTLDTKVAEEIRPIFKGMNLSQANAQKLVDFYIAKTSESNNQPYQVWNDMQAEWVKQIKSDPSIGPRLNEVKTTIARAIDGIGDPALAQGFREAMDFTGAGNNPFFIKMFWKMSQMLTEGRHVPGNGPSPAGQRPSNQRPSAAQAMYPNLP